MYDKIAEIKYRYEDNKEIVKFHLFDKLYVLEVKIKVSEDFVPLLNNLTKQFTLFELKQFVILGGKHTKTLFRLCKQWQTKGKTQYYSMEELKKIFDCENYENKNFTRLLNKAIKELMEKGLFTNLTYIPKKDKKRGSPVIGYTFTFDVEKPKKKLQNGQAEQSKQKEPKSLIRTDKQKIINKFNQFPQREYSKKFRKNVVAKIKYLSELHINLLLNNLHHMINLILNFQTN